MSSFSHVLSNTHVTVHSLRVHEAFEEVCSEAMPAPDVWINRGVVSNRSNSAVIRTSLCEVDGPIEMFILSRAGTIDWGLFGSNRM